MRRLLMEHCGDALIENTWKTFFCVSGGEATVHKEGYLWRALRASAAIPGLVPPMVADGQLFVDGGIINNFPASVLSSMLRGPVVGVDVTSDWKLEAQAVDIEDKSLLWLLGKGRKEAPNIVRILRCSGTISGDGGEPRRGRHIDPPGARVDRHVVVPCPRQGRRSGLPRRRSRHRTDQARAGGRNPEMGEFLAVRGRRRQPAEA
jgi:predicted acylesterase/phospholipase RssA